MWRAGVSRIKWLHALSAIRGGILMAKGATLLLALSWAALFLMPSAAAQTEVPVSGVISETVTIAASEWRRDRVGPGGQGSFLFLCPRLPGLGHHVSHKPPPGLSPHSAPNAPPL